MKVRQLYLLIMASLLAIVVGATNPAWSVKDKKLAPVDKGGTEIDIKDKKADTRGAPDKVKDKEGGAGNTLKKNAVKGAGAAAAAGVATKKVKSTVKGN